MDKDLLDLLEKATRKEIAKEDKEQFKKSANELIDESKEALILITDKGISTVGRGIDVMTVVGAGLADLRLNRIHDDEMWAKLFEGVMNMKNDTPEKEVNENEEEKINELLEKLGSLNEMLEKLNK